MARREESSYAASTDDIAALALSDMAGATRWQIDKKITDEGRALAHDTVDIKTRASVSSLSEVVYNGATEISAGIGTQLRSLQLYTRTTC